jgi:hypothetical protein
VILDLTLDDLERSDQGHVTLKSLYLGNGALLGTCLLLMMYINSYERLPLVILDVTVDDLERSDQGHVTFKSLYLGNSAC